MSVATPVDPKLATGSRKVSVSIVALACSLPGLVLLAALRPSSPDLLAQVARAATAGMSRSATWWTSWYGGVTTPSYSAMVPAVMRVMGVWTVGIVSAAVTIWCSTRLIAHRANAHLAVVLLSVDVIANVASGRITFAAGTAFGTAALVFVYKKNVVVASTLAAVSCLASPLAGMFLAMVALCLLFDPEVRRPAFFVGAAVFVVGAANALLFPLSGLMPMAQWDLWLAIVVAVSVWYCTHDTRVRFMAVLFAVVSIAAFTIHTPVGANVVRLPLLFASPLVAVVSTRRRAVTYGILTVFMLWTLGTTGNDLLKGHNPSADKSFYTPLVKQLQVDGSASNRVEVVDPATHGPAAYVSDYVPLARGWERQVDVERNPMFYDGTLNAQTYRAWLDSLAVKWVAVPNAPLDYGSRTEAALIAGGLPYLTPLWHDKDWQLYAVQNAAPMSTGPAQVVQVGANSITLQASAAGSGDLKVDWVRGLSLESINRRSADGLVARDGSNVHYSVPAGGTYILSTAG